MALFDDTFAPYVPFGARNLSQGNTGTDVAVLQAVYDLMIKTMNPASGPIGSPISIDGKFGGSTTTAVRAIQRYFALSVDGIVGPDTFFIFGQGTGSHTTYGGPVYGSRQLEGGDSGGDVTILQNRLNCFRYSSALGKPATGTFDAATANAVLAFKQDAVANGDAGFPANSIAGYGFYDATWLYTFAGGRAIESGRNGFDVVFVQVVLSNLRFYAGRINGIYDTATRAAVEAFQRANGISVDGVVGPVTFFRLGRNNIKAAPSPLDISWPAVPTRQVGVCSVGLTSTITTNPAPYGAATIVTNEAEGFESLDVTAHELPSLSGTTYDRYNFTLTDPTTGQVVVDEEMTFFGGANNWVGMYTPGVVTIPTGTVRVYAHASSGSNGSPVLTGNLADC